MGAASVLQDGSNGPARWSLRLLGDFQLLDRGSGEKVVLPGKRERVLLAYLALSTGGRQPRRKLVTLLWGEAADETTLDNLRTSVFNLRKALGDAERSIVASEDRDIVLDASAFEVDVLAVRCLAARSGVADLEEAAKLYAGDFLDGLSIESEEFESWRREESTRCKGQVLDALTKLMTQLAASGESERAIEAGLRILRLEPLHEAAARSLMRLYAGGGRRATAVELYRTLCDSLKKELGAQPEAETRAVYAEIARGNEGQSTAIGDVKSPPPIAMIHSAPSAREHVVPLGAFTPGALQQVNRRKIGWLAGSLAGAAALAIVLFIALGPSLAPAPTGRPATVVAATPTSAIALAVLPFANLSGEQDQEFFSDGLTEEIASALAKVHGLRLIARTSAFEFKGQNRNIRTIGEQLGATHLIEGSVRRAGDRVRITVQLIRADDGTRIWSDDYDRQLTDIFAIQEEIARAVASSLRAPLGLEQRENLVNNRSIAPESYEQYLRAKSLVRARGIQSLVDGTALLEQVVARDPDYAPAWALLAFAYQTTPNYHPAFYSGDVEDLRRVVASYVPKAESAARRAITLDANLADGYVSLGRVLVASAKLLSADETLSRALALDPNNPDALHTYSLLLAVAGHLKESLTLRERLQALEQFVPAFNRNTASVLFLNGQIDAAIAMVRDVPGQAPDRAVALALMYAADGRYGEAADALEEIPSNTFMKGQVETAQRLLRIAPANAPNPETLPRLGPLSPVYVYVGAPGKLLDFLDGNLQAGYFQMGFTVPVWQPSRAPVRKLEAFKAFVRNAGLVEYWRAKGWPDLCRPVGADDFVCE